MTKHLVLVGGGHAHLMTLAALSRFTGRGHRVTVIQPSPCHYYSGMGPGMLGGTYAPEEIRFETRRTVEAGGGTFLLDRALKVDPHARRVYLESGEPIDYDVLSFNAGSYVPGNLVTKVGMDIFFVKPIESLILARRRLQELAAQKAVRVAVAGGGAAAVEIAGNAWRVLAESPTAGHRVTLYAGGRVLERFGRRVRQKALSSFARRGIAIREGARVAAVRPGRIELAGNRADAADVIFVAVGVRPSEIFARSGLPVGPDGGLAVNAFLQCPDHPAIFGGGDCIHFAPRPLDKVGVYAVRQNPVLAANIMAALEERPLKAFDPGGAYLLILNMGDGSGVLYKNGLLVGGRLAFWAKDYIDRRFMRRFKKDRTQSDRTGPKVFN